MPKKVSSIVSVEWFGGELGGLGVVDVLFFYDAAQGSPDYGAIGAEGDVVDIPHVELEFLSPAEVVSSVTLRPAGDAGAYVVAAHLLGTIERQILHEQRAGANEAHITLKHVPQLGQLVERRVAHEGAEASDSLLVRQQLAVRAFALVHGLEFDNLERLALEAGALLKEKHSCALVEEMEQNGNREKNRTENYQNSGTCRNVDGAFEKTSI